MSLFKKIAMWLGIFIGSGLCFLLGLYLIATLLTSGLKSPIEKQLAAIRAEDAALAYSYTTKGFQANTSFEQFKKFINEYSGLRNNASISFEDREISDGVGIVSATLKSRGGSKTPIRYRLIKENDQWKIEGMVINPDASKESSTKSSDTSEPTAVSTTSTDLTNYYQNQRYSFSIRYPANWSYVEIASYGVAILGPQNTASKKSSVTAQYVGSQRRTSVQQLIENGKNSLLKKAGSFQIEEDGMLPPSTITNPNYQARYTLYSFTMNNQPTKQMEIIYFTNPNRAKYVIDYISSAEQFDIDLPIAKAMITSFVIP